MVRIPDPTDRLSPEAKQQLDELAAKRGTVGDMYRTMLLNPGLTERVSALGTFLRFESKQLSDRQRELTILRTSELCRAPYEWVKHEPVALEAGVDPAVTDALRRGIIPAKGVDATERALIEAVEYVLQRRPLPALIQDRLAADLGEPGLIEVPLLIGTYAMIAGFLATFEIPLPDGTADPFRGRPPIRWTR